MKKSYDKKHIDKTFAIGDWILVRNTHIDSGRPYKKLDHRYVGPFQVAGIVGKQAYQLILPPRYRRIHPTQHVSLLEPFEGDPQMGQGRPDPVTVDGEPEYIVERILKSRRKGAEYLVKWKGYGDTENTWEPRAYVEETAALDLFEEEERARLPVKAKRGRPAKKKKTS